MSKMPADCRSFHRVTLKVGGQTLGARVSSDQLEVGHGETDLLDAESGAGANPVLGRDLRNRKEGEQQPIELRLYRFMLPDLST